MTKICLNMIVKDESHIIEETLIKLTKKINFSYFIICDTGSTDNTSEIIRSFFEKENIPGEIYFHEWKNFGHNRTLALNTAYESSLKFDYILIFDADDFIEGDINLNDLTKDAYLLKFGSSTSAYERMCLVKSSIKWKYVGVLHEYITSETAFTRESLNGDYFIVSGRTSSRNNDPNKYLKDAKILEEGYLDSIKMGDGLHNRYAYYCANSYLDAGIKEHAIEWYKTTLKCQGWFDERYNSCLKLYELTNDRDYLVQSYKHNQKRVEGIFKLIQHYTCEGDYVIAWGYYLWIKETYEKQNLNLNEFLFANVMDYTFYLPYYLIIVCEKLGYIKVGLEMYKIIFEKMSIPGNWWVNNLVFNFQFFINKASKELLCSFKKYISFLSSKGISFDKKLISSYDYSFYTESNTILIYTGFSEIPWNISYSKTNALGGSERAVIYLAEQLKNENIIITGDVLEEKIDNIQFINRFNLNQNIIFKCIIVSRYASFFTLYPNIQTKKLIMMAHDTHFINNLTGCSKSSNEIIKTNLDKIDHIVYLTEWQKNHYHEVSHQEVKNINYSIINNGIVPNKIIPIKIKNSFIYTSGSFRGLKRLLDLWGNILELFPDATLNISSYEKFPKNNSDHEMNKIIEIYPSIKHHGKLSQSELYNMACFSEYWLYPCTFEETSCITALEMLASEVICLYYPIGGLTETMDTYGIQTEFGNEINTLRDISEETKKRLKKNGKIYIDNSSWKSRSMLWSRLINESFIKVINLKRRPDRREKIKESVSFIEAVDGLELRPTSYLKKMFEGNDHCFRRGVIGCALSHIKVWKLLSEDPLNNFYIILEDDVTFCESFFSKIKKLNLNEIDILIIGSSNISVNKEPFVKEISLETFKNKYIWTGGLFAYIISKKSAISLLKNIEGKSLTQAIDFEIVKFNENITFVKDSLVKPFFDQPMEDTDIQHSFNNNCLEFENVESADYTFKHIFSKNLVFYAKGHFAPELLAEYINGLNKFSKVVFTTDLGDINLDDFDEIVIVHEIPDLSVFELNKTVSYLNTEPLNIGGRICHVIYNIYNKFPQIKHFYDYSLSNIHIMNSNGINNTVFLEYPYNPDEIDFLKEINTCEKIYDFGIICCSSVWTNDVNLLKPPRRQKVVKHLISKGFKVNVVSGFGKERDLELAKCKRILNIHGQFIQERTSIFEHIRCNRLLYAGYNILSEDSDFLDINFVKKYQNQLEFINYSDFFELKKTKLIDCFTFYNEIELLRYRLELLHKVVDYFVIVEATVTYVGKPKICYFDKSLIDKYNIIYVLVDDMPFNESNIDISKGEQWINEKFQRECITKALEQIEMDESDYIIVSDVDEIPDPETLHQIKEQNVLEIGKLEQEFYYYNLNSRLDHNWHHAKIFKYSFLKRSGLTLNSIRLCMDYPTIFRGGWHLSYFGSVEIIANKIQNFSHQEYNNESILNGIQEKINNKLDIYNRPIKITNLPFYQNNYLPPKFVRPKYCFIHSCTLTDTSRLDHLMESIIPLKLQTIFINNIGKSIENKWNAVLTNYSENTNLFELPTINKIIEFSQRNDCDILYIHTKGVSYHNCENIDNWIDMMLYFLIKCKIPQDYDVLGCNYNNSAFDYHPDGTTTPAPPHFSGNFWWAKSEYLRTLELLNETNFKRNDAEYILFKNNPKYLELHNSGVNHYHSNYRR